MDRKLNINIIVTYVGIYIAVNILAVVFLLVTGNTFLDAEGYPTMTFSAVFNLVFYIALATGIITIAYTYLKDKEVPRIKDNVNGFIGYSVGGFFMLYASQWLAGMLGMIFKWVDTSANQEGLVDIAGDSMISVISLVIFAVLLAPIVEELVFRKAVYDLVLPSIRPVGAILVSAALFAGVHVIGEDFTSIASLGAVVPYLFMGIALGYLYHVSKRRIFIPIAAHMLWNLLAVMVLFFA
jgi:membrane protease YdiL (CAAX protease family)